MDISSKMILFVLFINFVASEPLKRIDVQRSAEIVFNNTRRILGGKEVGDTRPYMVYLRPASTAVAQIESDWLCGGAIIDERYILTSAACIEDAKHFYVVAGTNKWVSPKDNSNECINNGQKKAVWKCVPRSYVFDGQDFDNIRWMINDIAVVKVEDDFNFNRRIKGCDYIPKKIAYNNQSVDLEKPSTLGSIAGWGSISTFSDVVAPQPAQRSAMNSESLLETDVLILTKKNCKKRWNERYHYIIDQYMICGKDGMDGDIMSSACGKWSQKPGQRERELIEEREVNCKELVYSDEDDEEIRRSYKVIDPAEGEAYSGNANRRNKPLSGGFCENDHGGPLVVGHGKTAVVIGVISASQVREKTNQCYGPFLYTSVWNNRHLISCAIDKEMGSTCRRLLRASRTQMFETYFTWKSHPDGPTKEEEEEEQLRAVNKDNPSTHRNVFIEVEIGTKKPTTTANSTKVTNKTTDEKKDEDKYKSV